LQSINSKLLKYSCTGCPKKHGNSVTNSISSLLWISIVISNFKSHNIIMSARVYFMKMNSEDGQVVYCNFLVLLSTTVCSQNLNKQIVNIADETLTDYSFLRRYHYTKSKNYFKTLYQIRHWIPMFIGTPCTYASLSGTLCKWHAPYLKNGIYHVNYKIGK